MSAKRRGIRAEKKAETRAALRAAARECFAEQGYAGTQIGDIARRAGVAHGTFYVHFKTKEQLADELLVEFNDALAKRLAAVWDRHAREAPSRLAERVAEACLDHWSRERELLVAAAERLGAAGGLTTLRDGISPPVAELLVARLRAFDDSIEDVELVVQALLGMWLRVGLRYVLGPRMTKKATAALLARLSVGALGAVVPDLAPPAPKKGASR